ncbi:MAG: Gfo/Idh/MocA family oxidoreductase [Aggregatilineales bacterium]
MTPSPIRMAFIGAGLFARDTHVPSLLELDETYIVTAVCSRTRQSAEALAALLPYPVDITTDMDGIFTRDDVDVINVVLPIQMLAEVVEKAINSGKHVVSEKPIATTIARGRELIALARADGQQWMVAENWRYEPMFAQAGEIIRDGGPGKVMVFDWVQHIMVDPQNKYYHTSWRREGDFPGGFLLDGGVHHVAALRQVLGEVESVTAMMTQQRDDLPPADTLTATLQMASGAIGTYTITFAAGSKVPQALNIVGSAGWMRVNRESLTAEFNGERVERSAKKPDGVRNEFEALAKTLNEGIAHVNSPEEALQDVAVMEAMFESARTGRRVEVARIV